MKNLKIISFAFVACVSWAIFAGYLLNFLGYQSVFYEAPVYYAPFWYSAFMACIWAPLWEEAAFRYAPIKFAKAFNPNTVWPTVLMSSAIFGWLHGGRPEGVMIQGVLGLIFSFTYLKTGSIWCSIILHCLYNSFLTFLPLIIQTLTLL